MYSAYHSGIDRISLLEVLNIAKQDPQSRRLQTSRKDSIKSLVVYNRFQEYIGRLSTETNILSVSKAFLIVNDAESGPEVRVVNHRAVFQVSYRRSLGA